MIAKELKQQMDKSQIDLDELSHTVFRGKDRWANMRMLSRAVIDTGVWNTPEVYEMSREQLHEYVIKITHKITKEVPVDHVNVNYTYETASSMNVQFRGNVGSVMVIQMILSLGTEEQKTLFLDNLNSYKWITAYVQTELGHGSDVESLGTVAVFDDANQEFIINTNDLAGMKWWPGDCGLSATHVLIVARLIVKGKDHGPQCLFIQIRDPDTHKLLPGLETGDIGPKLGYNSKDNGFMRFTNFRVPMISLLGKYIKINSNGDVEHSGNMKVKYTGMMRARTTLLMSSYYNMFRALQIVSRYSVLRKQFTDSEGKEIRVFDYQLQRYKIVKHLCRVYAMSLGLYKVMDLIRENEVAISKGDFSYFQQLHLLLCQCKAFYTWWDYACVRDSIQACGGHGYSAYSGLVGPFVENFANQILEGENTLLCMQVAKYLLNMAKKINTGDTSSAIGQFSYMLHDSDLEEFTIPETKEALTDFSLIIRLFQKNSAFFVKKTSMNFMKFNLEGLDLKQTFNYKMGSQLLNMAKNHSLLSITENFLLKLANLPAGPIKKALNSLGVIFTCEIFQEYAGNFGESGSLTGEHFRLISELYEEHLEIVTPDILVLSEAMQVPDEQLASAIAHSNGKPYENLYHWAKTYGSLNKLPNGVHPAITKTLQHRHSAKL